MESITKIKKYFKKKAEKKIESEWIFFPENLNPQELSIGMKFNPSEFIGYKAEIAQMKQHQKIFMTLEEFLSFDALIEPTESEIMIKE